MIQIKTLVALVVAAVLDFEKEVLNIASCLCRFFRLARAGDVSILT